MKLIINKLLSKNNISLQTAIIKINKNGKKCLIIVDKNKKLLGILTDGDIRHALKNKINLNRSISNIYNKKPIVLKNRKINNSKIKNLFLKNKIFMIPFINNNKEVTDVVFVDDFLKQSNIKNKKINCDAFIMAGGLGKRLLPLTEILPKPLFPIDGIPIIQKIIQDFDQYKISKFFISLNYKSSILKAFLNELKNSNKFIYVSEKKPLGTAGSLKKITNKISNNFFLINADIYADIDINSIYQYHIDNECDLTVSFLKKNIKIPYGNCKLDQNANLSEIEEKPEINININSGIYVCNKKILSLIPKNQFYNMDELIKKCIEKKYNVKAYDLKNTNWTDIGEWKNYNSLLNQK